MSSEVTNILNSTAQKVFYDNGYRVLASLPAIGLITFVSNHYHDESWNLNKNSAVKLTDKERMATHYFRWRDLTVSLALSASILFVILFTSTNISSAIKVKLAISGGAIGFASLLSGCITYFYKRKALGLDAVIHPIPRSVNESL